MPRILGREPVHVALVGAWRAADFVLTFPATGATLRTTLIAREANQWVFCLENCQQGGEMPREGAFEPVIQTRDFKIADLWFSDLLEHVNGFLIAKNLDVHAASVDQHQASLNCTPKGTLRALSGAGLTCNVEMQYADEVLRVTVRTPPPAKKMTYGAAGLIAAVAFLPALAVTGGSAAGIFSQRALPRDLFDVIQRYVARQQ